MTLKAEMDSLTSALRADGQTDVVTIAEMMFLAGAMAASTLLAEAAMKGGDEVDKVMEEIERMGDPYEPLAEPVH